MFCLYRWKNLFHYKNIHLHGKKYFEAYIKKLTNMYDLKQPCQLALYLRTSQRSVRKAQTLISLS